MELAERVKTLRNLYGWSQRELAAKAGVTNSTLSFIEQGRVSPSVTSLEKILSSLRLTLAEFFALDLSAAQDAGFDGRSFQYAYGPQDAQTPSSADCVELGDLPSNALLQCHHLEAGQDTGLRIPLGQEVGRVISGRITLVQVGQILELEAGRWFYLEENCPYRLFNKSEAELSQFVLVGRQT